MSLEHLRSWWFAKQGLDGSLSGKSPKIVLERSGWARSVGGANPYLTLFSRAGIRREGAERATQDLQIHELPSARGCTYVLPNADFAIGLLSGRGFGEEAAIKTAINYLGVTQDEIDRLCDKVVGALGSSPLEPRQIKDLVGDASRNLGEEGKKRGQTTTLPLALGRLQSLGLIRRVPVNGRLDQQRYGYVKWDPSPLAGNLITSEEAQVELAKRFFRWIGPARASEFQWFSGLGVRAAKVVVDGIGVVPVEPGSEFLIFQDELDAFHAHKVSKDAQVALVASTDAILLHRREVKELLDPEDFNQEMLGEKKIYELGSIQDLTNHAILDRGRLIGLWEFDTETQSIAYRLFVPETGPIRTAIQKMQDFVASDLGDARSFSLDSPESRIPKIKALRGG